MSLEPHLTIAGNLCSVHKYHWPPPVRTVKHHILPKELGGPTTPDNLLLVCDNGHYSIHAFMDARLRGFATPKVTKKEQHYAELGLARMKNGYVNLRPQADS